MTNVKVTILSKDIDRDRVNVWVNGVSPTQDVEVLVISDKYGRYGDDYQIHKVKYEGPLNNVLEKIMEVHQYGVDEGEEFGCDQLLESIQSTNGDGCDFIQLMEVIDKSTGEVVRVI